MQEKNYCLWYGSKNNIINIKAKTKKEAQEEFLRRQGLNPLYCKLQTVHEIKNPSIMELMR